MSEKHKIILKKLKSLLFQAVSSNIKLSLSLGLSLFLISPSFASDDSLNILNTVKLEERLVKIQSDTTLTDEEKSADKALLQQAIQFVDKIGELNRQASGYKNSLVKGPIEELQLREKAKDYKVPALPEKLENTSLSNIETLLAKETLLLSEWRNRLTQINAEVNEEKSIDLQQLLQNAKKKLEETQREEINIIGNEPNSEHKQISRLATLKYYQAVIEMLEQKSASRASRIALLNAEQDLLSKKITGAALRQSELQNKVSTHRYNQAQELLTVTQNMVVNNPSLPAELTELAKKNNALASELKWLIVNYDQALNKVESIEKEAQRFAKKYAGLTEQLKITQLESSPAFGAALRVQRDNLVVSTVSQQQLDDYEQTLTQSRLGQFGIDTERELDIQDTLTRYQNESDFGKNYAVMQEIIRLRGQLLSILSTTYVDHIDTLSKLITHSRTLHNQSQQYAQLLEEELVWMPSHNRLNITTVIDAIMATGPLLGNFLSLNFVSHFPNQIKQFSITTVLSIGLLLFLLMKRSKLVNQLSLMRKRIGKVNIDNFNITLQALVISILLSLALPLVLYTIASQVKSQLIFHHPFATALVYSATLFLFFEFLSQSLRKEGLADLHFKWSLETLRLLRKHINWFKWAFLIVTLLTSYAELSNSADIRDSLGRVSFITGAVLSTFFIYKIFNVKKGLLHTTHSTQDGVTLWSMNSFIFTLILSIPILLTLLSAIGYHYMALQFAIYLLQSIFTIVIGIYLYFFARRGFAINERRLTYERILKKRALAAKQSDSALDPDSVTIEPEESNIQTISEQTESLLKMLIGIAMAFALWHIWSELFSTFQRLDNIYLWESINIIDGTSITSGLTLWDVLLAIILIIITFLAARNIPGLLEIAVLSRWSMEPGTNYAITTLSRYFIVITGALIVLQLLGAEWSKLQWLVAALSVGLGFGLQEIVANFVSGIVILFERPIRIGDTVTIGEQFGTVSQIRIRATTVVDWDRREIIIPNKTFITERLVNWSLSDPIIRTTIRVGVSYGSNIALTEQCLLEIAKKNTKILSDPEPVAWFREFGDSSLNFELRVFIKGIQDLNPVIHEVHIAIDDEFRQHNIEIAFPQRDIHFDPKPIEVRIVNQDD